MVEPFNKNKLAELPQPDSDACQRSAELAVVIKRACAEQGGAMPFSQYMQYALYTPTLGYYSSGLQKFGSGGDFITAPEVSPLFAQCLARQLKQIFSSLNQPCVLEFGAGSGVLAADLLLALEQLDALPETYYILELSADLQQRQKDLLTQRLPHFYSHIVWLQALPQLSDTVVIANEVLDAMPVECFSVNSGDYQSLFIKLEKDELVADYCVADEKVQQAVAQIKQRCESDFPDNYCSEYNPALSSWLLALYQSIAQGVVLLIDYGYHAKEYYHGDRVNGTLMCYYQHRAHSDALWYPGLQDITAFVDFTDVAYSAVEAGFAVAGFTSQAAFLLANGLSELHAEQVTDDIKQQVVLSQQIKTLTLPSEMGERFKVMALTKNYDEFLQGFTMGDYRNRL